MTQETENKFVEALEKLTELSVKHDNQIQELSHQVQMLIQQVNQLTRFVNRHI